MLNICLRSMIFLCVVHILVACDSTQTDISAQARYEGQGWQLLDQTHGGDGSAYGLSECRQCHVLTNLHDGVTHIKPIVEKKGYSVCAGCHGDNGTDQVRQCVVCHNNDDLTDSPLKLGEHIHSFSTVDAMSQDQECITCHNLSDMNGTFDLQVDLTRLLDKNSEQQPLRNISDFCLRCHNDYQQIDSVTLESRYENDPLTNMEIHYGYLDWHGYPDGNGMRVYTGLRTGLVVEGSAGNSDFEGYEYQSLVECTDCHAMHGTSNNSLLIASSLQGLSKLSPELTQQDISIYIEGDDYSQLCVMCHKMEAEVDKYNVDTGNGLAGVHETGSECYSCHRHGLSAQVGL